MKNALVVSVVVVTLAGCQGGSSSRPPSPEPEPTTGGRGSGGSGGSPTPAPPRDGAPVTADLGTSPPPASDGPSAPDTAAVDATAPADGPGSSDTRAADLGGAGADASPPADAAPGDADGLGPFPLATVMMARPELYAQVAGHIEGPSWRDTDLFFSGPAGLLRIGMDRKVYRYLPQLSPAGSYLLGDGRLILCDGTRVVQVTKEGRAGVLGSGINCNDLTVDKQGTIYFSDYGETNGNVYKITADGTQTRAVSGLAAPNGLDVDPASEYLYIAVAHNGVVRVRLGAGGPMGAPERVIMMDYGVDGMTFDAWGNLWVAFFTPGKIGVYDPIKRQVIANVDAGGEKVTNVTFGGPDHDTIFTTVDNRGVFRIPVRARGFAGHPGAPSYTIKQMLNITPTNQPL